MRVHAFDPRGKDGAMAENSRAISTCAAQERRWYTLQMWMGYDRIAVAEIAARYEFPRIVPQTSATHQQRGKPVERNGTLGYMFIYCTEAERDQVYIDRPRGIDTRPQTRRLLSYSVSDEEIDRWREKKIVPPTPPTWVIGMMVRIKDGPFTDFKAEVVGVIPDKGFIKGLVEVFGRLTPVNVDMAMIEPLVS